MTVLLLTSSFFMFFMLYIGMENVKYSLLHDQFID